MLFSCLTFKLNQTAIHVCSFINTQNKVNTWIIGDFQVRHLTELFSLKRFRQTHI